MNVFEMYVANGNKVGFKVRRNWWSKKSYSVVKLVQDKKEGPLEGEAPYYGNPVVICDFYFDGRLKSRNSILSCPGTYNYDLVKEKD
jgi:hypothetical protein